MDYQYSYSITSLHKQVRSILIPAIIAISMLMAGCGEDSTGPGLDNGGDDEDPNVVEMVGQSFSPDNLEVEVGTTVTWNNESSLTHTVTSGSNRDHDGTFDSGNVAPGESFSYTFTETGTFDYFCRPHTGMNGTITVVSN